jgi:hypothetical protein
MYWILNDYDTGRELCIKRDSDNASIPFDPANTDYQAYLAWLAEGNAPNPYVPPAPPTPLTAAEKLEAAGLTVDELKELLGL